MSGKTKGESKVNTPDAVPFVGAPTGAAALAMGNFPNQVNFQQQH